MGTLWECPQIFTLDGRAVMVSSVWDDDVLHYAGYAIGSYSDGVFHADTWGRLTYGDSYYAPSLFQDADGRHCLLFWMRGIEDKAAGWAGAHSVPYVLSLRGDRLVAAVHPDVAARRGTPAVEGEIEQPVADILWTDGRGGDLVVRSSDVTITLTWEGEVVTVREKSEHGVGEPHRAPVEGPVRIVVDGPVVEVSSAAGMLAVPTGLGSGGMRVHTTTGTGEVYPLS
jgi:beta-fructofuranosidase